MEKENLNMAAPKWLDNCDNIVLIKETDWDLVERYF